MERSDPQLVFDIVSEAARFFYVPGLAHGPGVDFLFDGASRFYRRQ